ncbi:MAG: hypothetical protein HC859_06280 [Bacteroidia bacterium]|nr:hypothetical protein [Bacteroidia bacterium]
MNGMVDPRMMPGYEGATTPAKRMRDNTGVSFYVRFWLKIFSLKNAAR